MSRVVDVDCTQVRVTTRLRALRPDRVESLATSMAAVGLIHPIRIRYDGAIPVLVTGRHRLEAARRLGWEAIRCEVVEDVHELTWALLEIDENLERGELSAAERVIHVARRKELWEELHPETRPTSRGGPGRGKPTRRKACDESGRPAERFTAAAAAVTGRSERAVQLDAARGEQLKPWLGALVGTSLDEGEQLDALRVLAKEAPGEIGKLVERAKAGAKVDAKTRAKQIRRESREKQLGEKIADAAATLGQRRYGVIMADPPWARTTWSEAGKSRDPANHYPTMGEHKIVMLPPPAAADCVLFLWTTGEHHAQAMRLIEAWGFAYKSQIIWRKPKISTGYWVRTRHETLLIATKGSPVAPAPGEQPESVVDADVGEHSEKPDVFDELVERLWPNTPKLEMYARRARPGWDVWGAEATAGDTEAA